MITPISANGLTISVRDLERSLAWYREKFGFQVRFSDRPNSPGVVIGAGDIDVCLQEVDDPATAPTVDHATMVCVRLIAFEVAPGDLDRVAAEFHEDNDIVVLEDHPRYRSRIVEDPDGHCIELYAWRPNGGKAP